nr:creatininase family protein [Candidatus Sigynarchaeota archaeon]
MLTEANRFRYEYMRPPMISEMLERCPLAIQPTGLLEWHGDQNPIGLDGLVAQYICERAIVKIGRGALMPTNFIGTYGYIRYPGSVVYDEQTVERIFIQQYQELAKLGFKVILILTGHWGAFQEGALQRATDAAKKEFAKKKAQVRLFGLRWCDFLFPKEAYGGHGQEGETSIAWRVGEAYDIPLVDVSGFKTGNEEPTLYSLPPDIPRREPESWPWLKNLKDPAICSPAIGERFVKTIAGGIAEELRDAIQELGIHMQ